MQDIHPLLRIQVFFYTDLDFIGVPFDFLLRAWNYIVFSSDIG
jgi:hypothetical protein